ncbi:YolD-like family protein [Parasporobacterium paucivorans]|uniref:YolD-like protein n=1 Tax=Parasporobacterium paucivorans DSM 15970 TaxID=1122934 RepID=A0A1M6HXS4_9FIRM|nr:YolD-like family protein [Parasporobacterium paucivorans]SHJ26887.1 YolD-like protein [Parasporobacterium paucivorans DSM 15970]
MATKPRGKMPVSERAKQFLPFAALKGLPEALAEKEKIIVPKIELSEEMAQELNQKFCQLKRGTVATITYFHEDEYLQITGMVALIDEPNRILRIVDTKIPFDDVLDING